MATPPKGPPGPEFEVPDLDVEASVRPPARHPGRRSGAAPAPETDPFADGFEFAEGAAVSLELGTGQEPGRVPSASTLDQYVGGAFDAPMGADLELDSSGSLPLEPVAAVDDTPWPSGSSKASSELVVDPSRVSSLAGYGAPGPLLFAPYYAYRVFIRQRALKHEVADARRALDDAEQKRAELLEQMVQSRRTDIERNERFARLIDPLRSLEVEARERQRAVTDVHGELAEQVNAFDAKLKDLEARRLEQQKVVGERAGEHNAREEQFGRASAKHRRVQIEIRNLEAKVREVVGPQGGVVPPELAKKLQPLHDQLRALEPNVQTAKAALDSTRARLAEADALVAQTTRAMAAIEKEKRALIAKYEARIATTSASLREAEDQERDAFLAIARAVLDLRGAVPVDVETRKRIAAADELVDRRLVEHELCARALQDFDQARRSLGHKMVIGAGVVLLMLIVIAALV